MNSTLSGVRKQLALTGALALAALLQAGPAAAQWLYATATTLDVAGVTVTPRDVVTDLSGAISTAPILGLPATTGLTALHDDGGTILFATRSAVLLPGSIFLERRDVGSASGGSFGVALDGSAAGLPASAGVDGVSRDVGGDLLLSLDTFVSVGGVAARNADVLRWDGASFSLYFDASSEGVPAGLGVDGVHYDPVGDDLLLSFDGAGSIDGVSFGREDVVRFDPNLGTWSLELDASTTEPDLATSNLVAVPEPGALLAFASGVAALLGLSATRSRKTR